MSLLCGESKVVRRGGSSGLVRFGVYALVVAQKALLCLILLQAGLEGGFAPEAAEHAEKLAEALGPAAHRDERHHGPRLLAPTHILSLAGEPSEPGYTDPTFPLANPCGCLAGPRAPPVS